MLQWRKTHRRLHMGKYTVLDHNPEMRGMVELKTDVVYA